MNATPANSPIFGSIHVIISHDVAKIHVPNGRETKSYVNMFAVGLMIKKRLLYLKRKGTQDKL